MNLAGYLSFLRDAERGDVVGRASARVLERLDEVGAFRRAVGGGDTGSVPLAFALHASFDVPDDVLVSGDEDALVELTARMLAAAEDAQASTVLWTAADGRSGPLSAEAVEGLARDAGADAVLVPPKAAAALADAGVDVDLQRGEGTIGLSRLVVTKAMAEGVGRTRDEVAVLAVSSERLRIEQEPLLTFELVGDGDRLRAGIRQRMIASPNAARGAQLRLPVATGADLSVSISSSTQGFVALATHVPTGQTAEGKGPSQLIARRRALQRLESELDRSAPAPA